MSDRTTINVPKRQHSEAGNVKDEHDETWSDVLAFYRHFRDEFPENPRYDADVSVGGLGDSDDGSSVDYDDVKSACRAAIRDELPVEQMGGR